MASAGDDLMARSGAFVDVADVQEARAALGTTLRAARERRALSVQQIADLTRIPRRHLESLERGDLESIPAGPYRRSEVIVFAQAVGLDRDEVLHHFERAVIHTVPTRDRRSAVLGSVASSRERILRSWPVVPALGLIMLGALLFWTHGAPPPAADAPIPLTGATADPLVPVPTTGGAAQEPQRAGGAGSEPSAPPSTLLSQAPGGIEADASALSESSEQFTTADRQLVVVTVPEGARVTVDGIGWGETPVTIRYLSPGPKRVRVTHDGFAPIERLVSLAEGTTTVNITLE